MSGLKRKEKKIIADFGNGKANYGASQNIGAWELLGKAAARLPHSKSLLRNNMRDLVSAEEVDEEFGEASGFFVLEPVRGVGKGVEFSAVAVAQAVVGHFREEEGVALAPEDAGGDMNGGIGEFGTVTKGGAIPVDHGGESAGLRPCGAIEREIFGGEGARTAGADERPDAKFEIERGERGFGKPGQLEEEHVPTATKLAAICF